MVRPFTPVFQRREETTVWDMWKGQSKKAVVLRYERWSYNWWRISKTSIPKKLWAIARARRKKLGQLSLLGEWI
jgi:hypothetical protein